jgi:hypothetical protein
MNRNREILEKIRYYAHKVIKLEMQFTSERTLKVEDGYWVPLDPAGLSQHPLEPLIIGSECTGTWEENIAGQLDVSADWVLGFEVGFARKGDLQRVLKEDFVSGKKEGERFGETER